jgi:hypothetical protein
MEEEAGRNEKVPRKRRGAGELLSGFAVIRLHELAAPPLTMAQEKGRKSDVKEMR